MLQHDQMFKGWQLLTVVCAGVRAGAKGGKSSFLAAHMDHSMGPRPQDAFKPPMDNSNERFQPQTHAWQAALPDCPALDPEDASGLHPLQKKLAYLTYQPWQLEAPEPIAPQVRHLAPSLHLAHAPLWW